jgi:hypothetical protein
MRVLVCGGRNYRDRRLVFHTLDSLVGISTLIHGCASGADGLAARWARARGVPQEPYPPNWRRYGLAAGPIRNQQMLDEGRPDLVVAFPGGKGTFNMVDKAEGAGVRVLRAYLQLDAT